MGITARKDFNLFLCHARGSLHELETQLLIAHHLHYLTEEEATELAGVCREIGRMLHGLITFATAA